MADHGPPELLEDQLRRMIISNGSQRAPPPPEQHQQHPTVRLPPALTHHDGHVRQHDSQTRVYQDQRCRPVDTPQHFQQRSANLQNNNRPQQHARSGMNDFQRDHAHRQQPGDFASRSRRELYDPTQQHFARPHYQQLRAQYLDQTAERELSSVQMTEAERTQKHEFRVRLEQICQEICSASADRLPQIKLKCFGSFESGFATAGSDMDLVIVSAGNQSTAHFSLSEDDLPRLLEKRLLQLGIGARLLTRTRVPIIKVCELPSPPLLSQLRVEREKWDMRDRDAKYGSRPEDDGDEAEEPMQDGVHDDTLNAQADSTAALEAGGNIPLIEVVDPTQQKTAQQIPAEFDGLDASVQTEGADTRPTSKRNQRPWVRDRNAGPLDFPKDGVGVQCDINFFNPLGLHNTEMLRCYSMCDQRVRQVVLFVKAWAKRRKINSAYSGTLSSYGYVLMVLHYLVNIARPPVLPNLQQSWRPIREYTPPGTDRFEVDGWVVDFWRREDEIQHAAANGLLTRNTESVGSLLTGFFQYFAAIGEKPFYHWTMNALSLRTFGGILMKEDKGWIKARTEEGEGKKVQYRYLFCIEDPFELDHNVARTVTHNGIVAIRDEFRRAARILFAIGNQQAPHEGLLFDEVAEDVDGDVGVTAARPDRRPPRYQQLKQKQDLAPKQVDLTSKDAFPDLSMPQAKSKKLPPVKLPADAVHPVQQPTVTDAATDKGPGKKRRRPQRKTLKINEL